MMRSFWAFGMGTVPRLGIPGEDLEGVWDAIEFIERVKTGEGVEEIGNRVAVIGAGNTAIHVRNLFPEAGG